MNTVAGLTAHTTNPSHRPTMVDSLFVCVTTVEQTRGQRQTGRNDLPGRVREVA